MNESYQNQLETLKDQLSIAISRILELEERFKCAKDITHMGMWDWDMISQQVNVSQEIYEIMGINPDDIHLTIPYIQDFLIHPDDRELFQESVFNATTFGQVDNTSYRVLHPTKKECYIRLQSKLISIEGNRPAKVMGVLIDVTDEVKVHQQLADEKDFIETLIDNIPNPIYYKDSDFIYRYCNQSFVEFIGLPKDQIIGKTVYDVAPPEQADVYYKADADLFRNEGKQTYESTVLHADGTLHYVLFNKGIHRRANGKSIGIIGLMQDITESRRNELQLKMLYKVKDVFLNINHNLFSYKDDQSFFTAIQSELQLIFASREQSTVLRLKDDGYLTILVNKGFNNQEAEAFNLKYEDSFIYNSNDAESKVMIVNDIASRVEHGIPKVITSKNTNEVQSTMSIPLHINGKLRWIICLDSSQNNIYTDTDLAIAEYIREELPILYRVYDLYQQTLHLSKYDGLTGLFNRRTFDKICESTLDATIEDDVPILIALFDLNGLKKVNDTYGHHIGDAYIMAMTDLIHDLTTPVTTFGRIGGDEFAGMFLKDTLNNVTKKILTAQQQFSKTLIHTSLGDITGGFSFGIAEYGKDGKLKSELLKVADKRMYANKPFSIDL